jgi:beta-phosphoglucomutase-like phosphatase (HAD superfamily)
MNRSMRRGIFFDLDGTLADSNDVMRHVFDNFAKAFGRAATDAEFDGLTGQPAPIIIAKLKRDWALPQRIAELLHRYNLLIDAAFLTVPLAPGTTATLEAAFQHGWKVGVVTSNAAARSRAWLARHRLTPFVEIVVGGDEICLGKPQPEPYRVALARSGCTREASIVVEASLLGARSALAAGLRTFGYAPEGRAPIEWPDSVRLIGAFDELMPELTRQRSRRVSGMR